MGIPRLCYVGEPPLWLVTTTGSASTGIKEAGGYRSGYSLGCVSENAVIYGTSAAFAFPSAGTNTPSIFQAVSSSVQARFPP